MEKELKGLMRQYALMLFQRERKGELQRVEKKQKELNAQLGETQERRTLSIQTLQEHKRKNTIAFKKNL